MDNKSTMEFMIEKIKLTMQFMIKENKLTMESMIDIKQVVVMKILRIPISCPQIHLEMYPFFIIFAALFETQ